MTVHERQGRETTLYWDIRRCERGREGKIDYTGEREGTRERGREGEKAVKRRGTILGEGEYDEGKDTEGREIMREEEKGRGL